MPAAGEPHTTTKYGKVLACMNPGATVFAFESGGRGVIAAGIVREPWDQRAHQGRPDLFKGDWEQFYRLRVDWDLPVCVSGAELKALGFRFNRLTVDRLNEDLASDAAFLALALERLTGSNAEEGRERSERAELNKIVADPALSPTEKEQLTRARIGQGRFRAAVCTIERACRLTGVADSSMLRASHIKPWRNASNTERLDGNNGLLLAPHVDHLFDRGWITFAANGALTPSPRLPAALLAAWGLPEVAATGPFNRQQQHYLAYHDEHIFKR